MTVFTKVTYLRFEISIKFKKQKIIFSLTQGTKYGTKLSKRYFYCYEAFSTKRFLHGGKTVFLRSPCGLEQSTYREIRTTSISLSQFKKSLKTHLFNIAFAT